MGDTFGTDQKWLKGFLFVPRKSLWIRPANEKEKLKNKTKPPHKTKIRLQKSPKNGCVLHEEGFYLIKNENSWWFNILKLNIGLHEIATKEK